MSDGKTNFHVDGDLICECLVREICHASCWQSIAKAHEAILRVRQMQKGLASEGDSEPYQGNVIPVGTGRDQ